MAHVEAARDVGRRNRDAVGRAFTWSRGESPLRQPFRVPLVLHRLRLVSLCQLHDKPPIFDFRFSIFELGRHGPKIELTIINARVPERFQRTRALNLLARYHLGSQPEVAGWTL